jgi:SOS response regulatory protein OraA/RecX
MRGVSRPTSSWSAKVAALRPPAARRMTEAQLWARLLLRGFSDDEVRLAVDWCKRDGYVDDALFARLFVEGRAKAVGDARLVAELVRRGVDRKAAAHSVSQAEGGEESRLEEAVERLFRVKPGLSYPGAARALERLGFPASAIYRRLRLHASQFGPLALASEESHSSTP